MYPSLDWDRARVLGPRIEAWLALDERHPELFEPTEDHELQFVCDAYFYNLVFAAVDWAAKNGIHCPVCLHDKLRGFEGRQVIIEMNDGSQLQVWVGMEGEWMPHHTIRERKNGRDTVQVSPSMPIKKVQAISQFARQRGPEVLK